MARARDGGGDLMPVQYSDQLARYVEYEVVWAGTGPLPEPPDRLAMAERAWRDRAASVYHGRPTKPCELITARESATAAGDCGAPRRGMTKPKVPKELEAIADTVLPYRPIAGIKPRC